MELISNLFSRIKGLRTIIIDDVTNGENFATLQDLYGKKGVKALKGELPTQVIKKHLPANYGKGWEPMKAAEPTYTEREIDALFCGELPKNIKQKGN